MDLPTLLVRETVQNSWDAGQQTQVRPIEFRIDAWTMTGTTYASLRDLVFTDRYVPGLPLENILLEHQLPVIVISDRGTTGLGGSTRADILTSEASDFADFVRNVGQPPDKERGGGTYGYGKAVLFLASRASTIIAYTRCVSQGRSESRLIAIGLGDPFPKSEGTVERLYTGRHWWGVGDPEAGIEPLVGNEADEVSRLIGLPEFTDGSHGTSIMIIGAEFGELELAAAVREMGEAILWHCWPKMLLINGEPPAIQFSLSVEGQELLLPTPEEHPDLRGFIQAYRVACGDHPEGVLLARAEAIGSQSQKRHLGQIGIAQFLRDQRLPDSAPGRPFTGPPHHVALMREPRLVVTYLPGPEPPVPGVAWAGAFVADDSVDRAFAAAEPPTHDAWTPDVLPRSPDKTSVNVALRKIREAVKFFARPEAPPETDVSMVPLAGIATALGGLLSGDSGPGTRSRPSSDPSRSKAAGDKRVGRDERGGDLGTRGSHRGRRQIPRVDVHEHELVMDENGPAVDVRFRVLPAMGSSLTIVYASPAVAVNDGAALEREAPIGAERPRILHWRVGGRTICSQNMVIEGAGEIEGCVRVLMPQDTSIAVSFLAEAVLEIQE